MRFEPTSDQRDFAAALEGLIAGSDPIGATRSWADGDHAPGLRLWTRLAETGVHALLVPEDADGMGATPVELVVAFETIGRHALPGPWAESVAYLPTAVRDAGVLADLAGGAVGSVSVPPVVPYAVDADAATHRYRVDGDRLATATPTDRRLVSVDRSRTLVALDAGDEVASGPLDRAFDLAALATAAQLLGAGERVLADTVTYARQRRQFGREIGSYQALKHQLADVRIALDFARPLVHGAALATADSSRAVSAAKVACSDAAYLAARTGLQIHGAIGYTSEFDLSIWLTRIRALVGAWGTPAHHRSRVLASLVGEG